MSSDDTTRSPRGRSARYPGVGLSDALELARLHGADRVVTLPDLGVYGLLLQLNDPRELVRFADHALAPLRKYDERKNAQLVSTLRTTHSPTSAIYKLPLAS